MVTEQEVEAMKRGFVGGGAIIAAVLSVAALVAILVGATWAVWSLLPLAAMEVVFLALWVRRRRRSSGPQRVR
jgi:membrane protein implicated in regulation of membrane protease activity